MADLLDDSAAIARKNTRYRCLDRLLKHREALFSHLTQQWRNLFNAHYDVLLYDLTSPYFECDPPETSDSKRRFGHSRNHRPDCVQVVIALVVTPEGFPLVNVYEIESWLRENNSVTLESLWQQANAVRAQHVGDEVHLRGLIEISNYCIRRCAYCGLEAGNREHLTVSHERRRDPGLGP